MKFADSDISLICAEKFGNPIKTLSGKVIWITGASSGIGESLAYDLASVGAKLALSGTNEEKLANVKRNCIDNSSLLDEDILLVPFNMNDFKIHELCTKKVLDHFEQIDILVNNAGCSQRAAFESIEIQVDRDLFDINVFGTVNLTRKVLVHFLERGAGHFVVNTSCCGKLGAPGSASYTGSKHALHGYFECLRTETARKGIDVTIIAPGPVFSGFLERSFTDTPGKVFGQKQLTTDKRMTTPRCSYLSAVAIANKLDEAWIALQPCLIVYYLAQYTPSFFRNVLIKKYYTPERAKALREGRL